MATLSAEQLTRIRRMTDEPTGSEVYTDEVLQEIASRAICDPDVAGESQFEDDGMTENADFQAVWDFHVMAAEIWEEKGGAVAKYYDHSANGGNYSRSQWRDACMQQARYHRSRRAIRSVTVTRG